MQPELEKKLKLSEESFQNWKKKSFEDRQELLLQLSDNLLKNKNKYAELITSEMNKPITQSVSEIEKCAGMVAYYGKAENILRNETVETEFEISEIHHEPMGVVLGVMPWNFPFWQALRFAVPAILAGNTVLLKHASICLGSGEAMQNLFIESGFPAGIFTHHKISHEEVEELLSNPVIKAVSLTGSEEAGKKIAEIAGRNLKKCVLELGGSDAFIVLDDADIDKAAKDAALARLQNYGQTCVAGKRFIIHQNVYKNFLPKFVEEYKKYHPENPENPETKLGFAAREDLADDLLKQYNEGLQNGAEIIVPLQKISANAFEPGLIKMNKDNPLQNKELFGPLGMVFIAEDDQDALNIANCSPFGLANAVYSRDRNRAMFFAENLESGSVAINKIFRSDVRMPFGGRKNSGYGIELSLYALHEFTVKKSIMGNI